MTRNNLQKNNLKPSGIDWLGDIPVGWQVAKFKELFRVSNERVRDDSSVELPLSVSGYRGVEPRDIVSMEGQMPSEDVAEYRIVRKGQLAVNTMWLNYTGLGVSEYEGYVSPAYRSYNIKPRIDKRYAHHLLRSPLYVQKYTSLLYGVRPNSLQVKTYDFEHMEILLPPFKTQKQIADFLDKKTKIIDELIEKKGKHIELLHEKRAALITRVVTKGLNPKAKMKPSGISWLGDIPEGWEVRKVKYLISRNDGGVWGDADDPEGIPVLRSTEVSIDGRWRIDEFEFAHRALTPAEIKKGRLDEGDLVVTKSSGSEEHIGKTAIVDKKIAEKEYCYSNFMQRLRPKRSINPKLLYYFLNSQSAREQYKYLSNSTTGLGNLNASMLNLLYFLLIPTPEQQKIVDFLDTEIEKIDKAVALIESQIEKLKEYRSSLIYSAVTGKIRV